MAQDETKQEQQAADEEQVEVAEAENQEAVEEIAEEAAAELTAEAPAEEPKAAKAGKRSAKAQREADEAEAKEEAKEQAEEAPKAPAKQRQMPNPLKRHGKNYRAARELVDPNTYYEITEAVELAKKSAKTKFDPSVELHVNLGVDPRQADQMVRDTVVLPAGTGKSVRIAVLAPAAKHAEAKKAGADIASDGDILATIEKGKLDFDVLVSTPDMMANLSKVAKVLGPRGLMPNPKSGTVTPNVGQAVEQAKAGRVEFRIDKQAIVHMAVGKVSFSEAQLADNLKTAIDAVLKAKPGAAKGTYIQAISVATSMGPGIKLDVQKAIAESHK